MKSRKKSAVILIAVILVIAATAIILVPSFLGQGNDEDDSNSSNIDSQNRAEFRYIIEDGGITIKEYTGTSLHPEIPSEIDGYKVLKLSSSAFAEDEEIVGINLPDTLSYLEEGVFKNCISLEMIEIPAAIKSIPFGAFDGCTALNSVKMHGDKSISDEAFKDCAKLEIVNIDGNVTSIGNTKSENYYAEFKNGSYCFAGCFSLKTFIVTGNIGEIFSGAFYNCNNLESILIGGNIETIWNYAFFGCSALGDIALGGYIGYIEEHNAFENTLIYPDSDGFVILGGHVLVKYSGDDKSVVIPDKVTSISTAFKGNSKLSSLKLPSTLEHIGREAFADCISLTHVKIPASVKEWGWGAFHWCLSITSIELEEGLTVIGEGAFFECEKLKSIRIPRSVTEIGDEAFGYKGQSKYEITIYGEKSSVAEKFAEKFFCKFVAI